MTVAKILTCLSIVVVTAGIASKIYTHDKSLARASSVTVLKTELNNINEKFEAYKKADRQQRIDDQNRARAIDLDKRIYLIEQRFLTKPMPVTVKEELYRLRQELKGLRK